MLIHRDFEKIRRCRFNQHSSLIIVAVLKDLLTKVVPKWIYIE